MDLGQFGDGGDDGGCLLRLRRLLSVELGRSISPAPQRLTFWPEEPPSDMIHAIPEAVAQVPGL